MRTFAPRSRSLAWAAYAACGWTLGYTALKLYWAVGGTALRSTIGFPDEVWQEPSFIAIGLWGTVALGLFGAAVALALARPWGARTIRWLLLTAAWGASALLLLRGVAGIVQGILALTGALTIPESVARSVIYWDFLFYSPYFLVWGILWAAAAWWATRRHTASTTSDPLPAR
ncbi:MAG: DUF3995 domain-containing protein [Ardenticatenaceae bacterium]